METANFVGSLLGVEVESLTARISPAKQLEDMQTIVAQEWDFVAIHPAASDALIDAADAIIGNGTPLIVMDTRLVQDPEAFAEYGHLTFLEPDNIYMGSTVANELFNAIGGEGEVIHTQGQLGHTGAQRPRRGFQPDASPTTRTSKSSTRRRATGSATSCHPLAGPAPALPECHRRLLPQRRHGARGGQRRRRGRLQDQVKLVGVDGLKNACEAIIDGRLLASVINPSGRIHGGAIWAGYLTVSGTDNAEGGVPKFIRTDGGPITQDNAAGYIWLHDNFQY